MKTLVFNGSPRKEGDCAALLGALTAELGGEITFVSAYYDGISPCVDCRFCKENEGCAIDDGMTEIYKKIVHSDCIVIASPLYYSELSGALLALMSRLQTFYCARRFRGEPVKIKRKRGALILTGGGDGSPDKARETANVLFKAMNTLCVAEVISHNTDELPARLDGRAMADARAAAMLLKNE